MTRSSRHVTLWLALALISVAAPAWAQSDVTTPSRGHGLLLGDDLRFTDHHQNFGLIVVDLFKRFAFDLVAIPAGFFTTWQRDDYAAFIGWSAIVLSLMIGAPSADVQLQSWVHTQFGVQGQRFTLWTQLGDGIIWAALWSASLGALLTGWFSDRPGLVEMSVLMVEAFGLAQVFHWVPKLLIGREGPKNGTGQAVIYGPARSLQLIPAGTPSGHSASVYAMMGVVSEYWGKPWLTVALQVFGAIFCSTMLVDDYHFASDLIWGAAMGWSVGTWVVDRRSSRFRDAVAGPAVRILPLVDLRTGAAAVTASIRF